MRTYFVDEEDFETYQTTAPDPIPVGHSRTRTVRFDDPPQVMARRRRLILYAFAEALDAALITVILLYGLPALAYDYAGMPIFAGRALALIPVGVWIVIVVRVISGIWPRANQDQHG